MEAATPLRKPHVRTVGDHLAVDGLIVDDETAVRLVRAREEAGEDAVALVEDAIEIGARVLDREQAGANAEFVKTEFEKAARDLQAEFGERAQAVTEQLDQQLQAVFGPDGGHLAKELERLFSDGSTDAVQHRVKELVEQTLVKSREELARQFSADDGRNPLAAFQKTALTVLKQASDQQDSNLRAMHEKLAALEKELQGLRDERQKQLELAEVEDRGTAKGRTFEEAVFDALDALAQVQGDDCEAVGDVKGSTGKTGDVVVDIEGCSGPARGRIVFEAKTSRLSRPNALRELDRARVERDADFAVLVVPSEEKVPARMLPLREHNGDKMIVTYEPESGSTIALQLAYALARARVLMKGGAGDGIDAAAVGDAIDRAIGALDEARKVKSQLTGATTSIETAKGILESMEAAVREHLAQVAELTAAAAEPEREPESGAESGAE
jgi:hypothetical protein